MRRFILLAFIGVLLMKNVTPSKIDKYPSNLAWLFGLNNNLNKSDEQTRTVCQTQECEKIAKVIRESMDKSVDPCDDFYEYACGKWPEHNPLPEGNAAWSLFYMVQETVFKQMKEILDTGPSSNDLLGVKLAKKWYSVCMDTDAMEEQGLDPLVFTVARIGGWPMIMDPDEWNEEEYSWQKVDNQYMRLMGRNAFHDVRVLRLSSNETAKVEIDTPHLPPGAYLLWAGSSYDSDEIEDEGDEDPSDEEKQSDEDNQEPGSEGENEDDEDDDENDDDNDNSDNDNDNGDNNDSINKENETDEQDKDAKKKISKKKSTIKIAGRKNRKLGHNEKRKSDNRITKKHNSHKKKIHRIKRGILPKKVDNKSLQHFTHRGKHIRRNKRVRVGKKRIERITSNDMEMMSTTPQGSTEDYDEDEPGKQKYADYISKVARALAKARGTDVPEEHINKDIEDMIQFQLKLTEIVVDDGDKLEMTLNEFQDWYDEKEPNGNSKINWVYKIAELFDEATVSVDGDLDVEISATDYFEALISLLDETPSRTIVNYIHWNFLSKMIKTTTNEMRSLYKKWMNVEESEEKKDDVKSRSSSCIMEVEMSDIVAYEYVSKYFSDDITRTASDMVDDIQKEVEYLIKESDWMDEDTKDFALGKLVNMKKFIGYPDWYKNSTIVKQYFQGLIICNSYYENVLSYKRYVKWKSLRKLRQDEDFETWWMNPMTVNAFFNPEANSILISAADFQSPLFAYGRPQAINYGIIGFVMAHEVNHGFDNTGHLYDKNGDFVEWLSVMAQAYGKRAACFVEQFNNYPVDKQSNLKLKNYGNQTIGDNIADTMGLQAVYKAYQRRERECGKPDTVLPGLEEVTHDQLFFLSFANLWCETVDPEMNLKRVKMDSHSTGPLRVIGSISNSEDFAKAYNCPVGSAMNPEKKCNIWK